VEPAAPKSTEADALPDVQQLYFCPMCVRSRRPSLDLLSTLTCSLQSLMISLPEAAAAEGLRHRATCWRDKVRQVLDSDEIRAVQSNQAEMSLVCRLARSQSGYIFQRGISSVSSFLILFLRAEYNCSNIGCSGHTSLFMI